LPIKRIIGGKHFISDLTLPHGRVLFDYLKDA
jgi:acetoacetate decarboxylase